MDPAIRRNEIVRLLEDGLQDISISRHRLAWGIPFPGDPDQTVYVWFDALINYLTATGFPGAGLRAAVARGPPRHRQGHHPVPLRDLARDAAGRGRGAARARSGPTATCSGGRQDVEDGGHGRDAGRRDRAARARCPPVLPAARGRLRGRWQLHLGAVRRALHRGPGGRAGQPGVPLAGDDREVPRGGGARSRSGRPRWTRPAGRRWPPTPERWTRCDLRGGAEAAWELVATANLYIQQVAPWKLAKEGATPSSTCARRAWPGRSVAWRCSPSRSSRERRPSIRAALGVGTGSGALGAPRGTPGRGRGHEPPESLFPKPSSV